jgi:predicted nucleic acid-binding protein
VEKEQAIAIDTGVIFALADRSDSWHDRCARFVQSNRRQLIVSCAVVPEVCYLLNNYLGAKAEAIFLQSLSRGEMTLDHFRDEDLSRCKELMQKYNRLNLGFVDVSVITMCERRNISTILTTDRKHFSVVRSKQDRSFQLLP